MTDILYLYFLYAYSWDLFYDSINWYFWYFWCCFQALSKRTREAFILELIVPHSWHNIVLGKLFCVPWIMMFSTMAWGNRNMNRYKPWRFYALRCPPLFPIFLSIFLIGMGWSIFSWRLLRILCRASELSFCESLSRLLYYASNHKNKKKKEWRSVKIAWDWRTSSNQYPQNRGLRRRRERWGRKLSWSNNGWKLS